MFRLLIVEDEENSRNGLQNILKQIPDLEIITAENGKVGYEKARILKPHIIISDLHMPVCDGLTMIEHLYRKNYSGLVYILTGYAEFKYAQKAMQCHVADYILKPVIPENLIKLIEKAVQTLKNDANKDSPQYCHFITPGDMDIWKQKISSCRYTDYFLAVIYMEAEHHLPPLVKESILQKENHYLLILPDKHYRGVLIGFYNNSINYNDIGTFSTLLQPYTHLCCVHETLHHCDNIDWILQFERLRKAIPWTISYQSVFLNYQMDMSTTAEEYQEDVFLKRELQKLLCREEYDKYQQKLIGKLYQMQKARCHPQLILLTAVSGLVKINSKRSYLNAVNQMSSARSFHEVTEILYHYFDVKQLCTINTSYSKLMQLTLSEIADNYKETITLNSTADKLGITPQYLSRLFMKEINTSFNDYLTNYRIEKAKELLQNTPLKINAISNAIGYPDAKYFCTLFKKKTGVTPNQFRGKA